LAYINKIGTANAPFCHQQTDIKDFAIAQYDIPEEYIARVNRMYDNSWIDQRYSAIRDFTNTNGAPVLLKSKTKEASTEDRMKIFFEVAPKMCEEAVRSILNERELQKVTHLITISCTGLSAPGLEVTLLEKLNLPTNTARLGINFMGCYAGFHGLKLAKALCAEQPDAQVLIVDVELCTLHFQNKFTMDNVASTLLFADGAAAILVNNQAEDSLYKIESFYTEVALKGKKDMAWHIGPTGFQMTLSSYIPKILGENISPLLHNAISNPEDIKHWAIHPGGKKILQEFSKALELAENDLDVSFDVLRQYGNMSSVTIFYVLLAMRKNISSKGENVFAAGFGPGLTIESAILST
jgi:predicted naringenin-chalcone synthase